MKGSRVSVGEESDSTVWTIPVFFWYVLDISFSPEGQPYAGLHQKQRGQQVEAGDSGPPLWWEPTYSPRSSTGSLSTGKTWGYWSGCRGSHKNDQGAGIALLWGKAERVGAVQREEEKALGRPCCSLSVLKKSLKERWGQTFQHGLLL